MRGDHHIGGQQGVEEAGTRAYPCVGFLLECQVLWSLRNVQEGGWMYTPALVSMLA